MSDCCSTVSRLPLALAQQAELQATITDTVPAAAATNPVDLTSAMNGEQLAAVTRAVAASGEVDACIVVVVDVDESTHEITRSLSSVDVDVPVAVAHTGRADPKLPSYPSAERAASNGRSLGLAARG